MNNINKFIESNASLYLAGGCFAAGIGTMLSVIWIAPSAKAAGIAAVLSGAGLFWTGLGIAMLHVGEKDAPKRKVAHKPEHSKGIELNEFVTNRLLVK